MRNYYSTLRAIFFILIGLHVSLYFFGLLRPSIIYDYLDYWPLTLFLIFLVLLPKSSLITESVKFYSYAVLISVMVIFLLAHFTKASFLGTYSYESSFSNLTLNESNTYRVIINENNSINLKSFPGTGYKVDILNKPGSSGYPEAVESLVGTPRVLVLRAVETSPLLQVKGWDLQLGDESKWELDIFGVDSQYSLDNLELNNASLSGTGEIYLGKNLKLEKLVLNGVYEITVSKNLPIVISGNAETPNSWINATIGTLNQVNESYRLLVEVMDGSEVIFNDE
ncbi:hypothetical protein N9Y09_00905 [Candidatus Actinomarina sp.]|nr:hypothetical protein [Acidimicrobiia bacterium]MDA7725107.1 hypothetical protein [Acidimicrobiaceae bacterium]MDA8653244.1 hypothetical protein [Candidatus Actinomarina sp.]MDA7547556.1 hypothetical protein [Acidimicrobiia bacterium]MDA8812856.1 hypothetical protein [Candidatus Actinomarina sp.]